VPTVTLLIYDCDGVLVDSEPIASAAMAELMTGLGHKMTAADAVRAFGGRSRDDVLRRAEQMLGRPIPDDAGAAAGRALMARFRRELKPVPGAAAAVAALPFPRCVASSSTPERIALCLAVTGLAPLFGTNVFSAAQVANGKPAPDLFRFAAQAMGASHAIVIEDTALGIEAARRAGMAAIGFVGASHADADLRAELVAAGADSVVAAMAGLPAAIRTLAA
jgi:HAD superfamily hydrolase (TIGR01509 family)